MRAQAQAWLQVEQRLQAQVDALAYELANTSTPTMGQLVRSRRYRALMEQTRDELAKYSDYLEPRIRSGQEDMITLALQHSRQAVNSVATEAGMVVQFDRLPVDAVNGMVGLAGDGSPLRTVLADASRVGPDAMAQELVNGIALGRNPIAVARAAMRLGLGSSFTRMQTIARTEQLRVYRETTLASYANSNVIMGYRRLSARDDRVCPACLMADGRFYQVSEGFDEHPNGRCSLIPVLRNVQPTQFQTGQEWFAQQPEATQRRILGAGRFDAWQSGRATLDDMVSRDYSPDWGGSLRATRVRDLVAGRGGLGPASAMPRVVRAAPVVPPVPVAPQIITADVARARILETTAPQRAEMDAIQGQLAGLKSAAENRRLQLNDLTAQLFRVEPRPAQWGTNPLASDLYAQLKAAQKAERDAGIQIGELANRGKDVQKAAAETARKHLRVDNPASVALDVSKRNAPEVIEKWNNSITGFNELVDSSVIKDGTIKVKPYSGRAHFNPTDKIVSVSKVGDDERVLLHEFGHWLEDASPDVHTKAIEFYDKRTNGEPLRRMVGYGPKETTRKDKFIDPYMGKEYKFKGDRYATEIVSMGLEYFYADPATLAVKDPDYFDFIFNLVRGR